MRNRIQVLGTTGKASTIPNDPHSSLLTGSQEHLTLGIKVGELRGRYLVRQDKAMSTF